MASLQNAPTRLYVGIVGHHGCGKSGLFDRLTQLLRRESSPVRPVRISFAQPIREHLLDITGRPLMRSKRWPLERNALQFIGELARSQDSNHWLHRFLDAADRKVDRTAQDNEPIVILADDVYHVNEAMAMDLLVMVSNPEADAKPLPIDGVGFEDKPYVAVSKRQTRLLLEHLPGLFPRTLARIEATSPTELNTINHAQDLSELVREIATNPKHSYGDPKVVWISRKGPS